MRSDGSTSTCSGRVTVEDVLVAGSHATLDDEGLRVDDQPTAPASASARSRRDARRGRRADPPPRRRAACNGSLGSRTSSGLLVSIPTPAVGSISEVGSRLLGSTSATAGGSALPTDLPAGERRGPRLRRRDRRARALRRRRRPPARDHPVEPRASAGFPAERVAYAFDGLPLSLLCGLVLLALAGAGRLRRYIERIVGLVS